MSIPRIVETVRVQLLEEPNRDGRWLIHWMDGRQHRTRAGEVRGHRVLCPIDDRGWQDVSWYALRAPCWEWLGPVGGGDGRAVL